MTKSTDNLAKKLTPTQRRALKIIVDAGGGALAKNGTVLCAGGTGEEFDGGPPVHSLTWLRLVAMGLIMGDGGRLVPTVLGRDVAAI